MTTQNGKAAVLGPFLRWAGGKRWLIAQYSNLFPKYFRRYVEPFVGSGAVFFHLRPSSALLADSNAELINTYAAVRSHWKEVERALKRHHRNHCESYYYIERARKHRVTHERAAQFIYLNRTCWNGLYRVNLHGEFNVPIGTKSSVVLPSDDLAQTSALLRRATLIASDFEEVIAEAKKGDFVFVDPPYITRHNFNGFLKYNDRIFSWSDQERLYSVIDAAARRGVKLLVTNAAHESVQCLYRTIGRQIILDRNSVLAANSTNRGPITEIAILINYKAGSE